MSDNQIPSLDESYKKLLQKKRLEQIKFTGQTNLEINTNSKIQNRVINEPVVNENIKALELLHREEEEKDKKAKEREEYYSKILLTAIIGILFYYLGASLLIFFKNVGGSPQVILPSNPLSWELLFNNFGEFLRNLLINVFGYFIEYAKLFGYFKDLGELTIETRPRNLLPVDMFIKVATILYFNLRWMKWDTTRLYNLGCFNENYDREPITKEYEDKDEDDEEDEIDTKVKNLVPEGQKLIISKSKDEDDEEEVGLRTLLPFEGVEKPIEEWYYSNEEHIYKFIRNRLLPGSNLILVFYFSTLNVLDFRQPLGIFWYVLGIMSMFWCMQTFLAILDHNQYPPEDGEYDDEE